VTRVWPPLALSALLLSSPLFAGQRLNERLVVCADPDNMPFSNRAGDGFENKLAQLIAHDLHAQLEYYWWPQVRGFVRKTLDDDKCDLWPGVATRLDSLLTTRPYYESTYVFVTRSDRGLSHLTLDDPRLATLSIGVQMIGNDAMNTPPAHALARRGLVNNIHGYMIYARDERVGPPILAAVAAGQIDVALVWGPTAGYFAHRSYIPLRIDPVVPGIDADQWPMSFSISVGVRRGDTALRDKVEAVLEQEKPRLDALLRGYHVPFAPISAPVATPAP
jgi:mxaJ protein